VINYKKVGGDRRFFEKNTRRRGKKDFGGGGGGRPGLKRARLRPSCEDRGRRFKKKVGHDSEKCGDPASQKENPYELTGNGGKKKSGMAVA